MAYIGQSPSIGNFQVCDAISVVNGQAAYTMQVSSVNVVPETANHMIVSLNGVIQAPGSSYTVSGSTITFASNLATGDVINFIHILGSVLDLGVPSDDTVSTAKISANAVTAAKFNADVISGQTALASEPADTDEFLVSDAGVLKRIDYSLIKGGGITEADQWRLTSNASASTSATVITANLERVDTAPQGYLGTGMSQSSGVFTFPSTGIWLVRSDLQFSVDNQVNRYIQSFIHTTTDNFSSNDNRVVEASSYFADIGGGGQYQNVSGETLVDCTNTSNNKIKFGHQWHSTGGSGVLYGSSTSNRTYFTFIRLGDT